MESTLYCLLPRCTVGQQGPLVSNGAPGGKAAPPAAAGAAGAGAGDGDGWVDAGNGDRWSGAGDGDGDGDGSSGARYVCVN